MLQLWQGTRTSLSFSTAGCGLYEAHNLQPPLSIQLLQIRVAATISTARSPHAYWPHHDHDIPCTGTLVFAYCHRPYCGYQVASSRNDPRTMFDDNMRAVFAKGSTAGRRENAGHYRRQNRELSPRAGKYRRRQKSRQKYRKSIPRYRLPCHTSTFH